MLQVTGPANEQTEVRKEVQEPYNKPLKKKKKHFLEVHIPDQNIFIP